MIVVGLMSGTSADAVDVAVCEIEGAPPALKVRLLASAGYPYGDFQAEVLAASQREGSNVEQLCLLNVAVAERFADGVLKTIASIGLEPDDIDLIGSHGQTVWHAVGEDGSVRATLQIGEAAVITRRTGITTIHNFRPADVAAGGQGAPLTAYADWLLLRHPTIWRAVQNIGGIGNVTLLPPLNDTVSQPLAFDTGPGNALIDSVVTRISGGEQTYDRDGLIAASGQVDGGWLENLMGHAYFERQPPKTTGRELFSRGMAADLLAEGQARGLRPEDVVATLTMLTAVSIADAYQRFAPVKPAEVILGGGGRHHPVLVGHLKNLLAPAQVLTHEDVGLDSDSKEALVFALLAYETWHNRAGTLPAFTGASEAAVLGQITPGANYASLLRQTWEPLWK